MKKYLNKNFSRIYWVLYRLKKAFIKFLRVSIFGIRYISIRRLLSSILKSQKKPNQKTILWVGMFGPNHINVGDHAQTYAVELFLKRDFPNYFVIKLCRHEVKSSPEILRKYYAILGPQDIVLVHSAGDFGSQYYNPNGYWHDFRREIFKNFNQTPVINLPTTVNYKNDAIGKKTFHEDKAIFSKKNLLVLCREQISLGKINQEFSCKTQFFPDFVFYLQRKPKAVKRRGVMLLLRSDKESKLNPTEKASLIHILKDQYDLIKEDEINAKFPLIEATYSSYFNSIMEKYEKYELVVTDRMHGMILAVTANTPCLALDSGIPHKISPYQSFINDTVHFQDGKTITKEFIQDIKKEKRYVSTDLTHYFDGFKKNFIDSHSNDLVSNTSDIILSS